MIKSNHITAGWVTHKLENNYTTEVCPLQGFPGGTVVKNLPANAGDTGSSPGPRRSHMLWSS